MSNLACHFVNAASFEPRMSDHTIAAMTTLSHTSLKANDTAMKMGVRHLSTDERVSSGPRTGRQATHRFVMYKLTSSAGTTS